MIPLMLVCRKETGYEQFRLDGIHNPNRLTHDAGLCSTCSVRNTKMCKRGRRNILKPQEVQAPNVLADKI